MPNCLPRRQFCAFRRRALLAQHNPERLLVVAEAQETGVSKATRPHHTQARLGHIHTTQHPQRLQSDQDWWIDSNLLPCLPLGQVAIPRGAWDDSSGLVSLTKYANAEARAGLEAGMLRSPANAYLAYAAAGALLK